MPEIIRLLFSETTVKLQIILKIIGRGRRVEETSDVDGRRLINFLPSSSCMHAT